MSKANVTIPYELLYHLVDAAQIGQMMFRSLANGETRDVHPDWNSAEYLNGEMNWIEQQGRAVLEAAQHTLAADFCPACIEHLRTFGYPQPGCCEVEEAAKA